MFYCGVTLANGTAGYMTKIIHGTDKVQTPSIGVLWTKGGTYK